MSPKTEELRGEVHDERRSEGVGGTEVEASGPRIRSEEQLGQDTRRPKMIKATIVALAAVVIVGGGAWAGAGAASDRAIDQDGSGAQPPTGKLAVPDNGNLPTGPHPRGLPRTSGHRRTGNNRKPTLPISEAKGEARGESGSPNRTHGA